MAVVLLRSSPRNADLSTAFPAGRVTPVRDRPGNKRRVTTLFLAPAIDTAACLQTRGWLVNRQESVLVWVEDLDQARPCSHSALCGTSQDVTDLEDLPVRNGLVGPVQPSWDPSRTLRGPALPPAKLLCMQRLRVCSVFLTLCCGIVAPLIILSY